MTGILSETAELELQNICVIIVYGYFEKQEKFLDTKMYILTSAMYTASVIAVTLKYPIFMIYTQGSNFFLALLIISTVYLK